MTGVHFAAAVVFAALAVAVLVLGIVVIIEHIIIKKRIDELKRAHGGMKVATSWLSCPARRDTSNAYPVMESEHVAVVLPEIVRCRDCAYWATEARFTGMCVGKRFNPDGFCAWGERRGDAE